MSLDPAPRSPATELLVIADSGDGSALDRLVPLLYEELREIALPHVGSAVRGCPAVSRARAR